MYVLSLEIWHKFEFTYLEICIEEEDFRHIGRQFRIPWNVQQYCTGHKEKFRILC